MVYVPQHDTGYPVARDAGYSRIYSHYKSRAHRGSDQRIHAAGAHKGLTKAQATVRHALKNCMVVILPSIFGEFIGILGGSLIIEKLFGVPGVGSLYINSIDGRDYPMFMMLTVFYTAIGLAASIVTRDLVWLHRPANSHGLEEMTENDHRRMIYVF